MYSVSTTIDVGGDRGLFERCSKRLQNTRELARRIGMYGVSRAVERLDTVLSDDPDAVRTGRLAASIQLFELQADRVVYGSNLGYAAQVHFGGTIEPATGKALAIPLTPRLKRSGLWPRDLDPTRELLEFIPSDKGIGVLVDPEGALGYGAGPLFFLARSVTQEPRPYLYLDDEDQEYIRDEIYGPWLLGE